MCIRDSHRYSTAVFSYVYNVRDRGYRVDRDYRVFCYRAQTDSMGEVIPENMFTVVFFTEIYTYIHTYPALQSWMDLGLSNDPPPDTLIMCRGLPRPDTHLSQVFSHVVLPSFSCCTSSSAPIYVPIYYPFGQSLVAHSSTCPIQPIFLAFINWTISPCFRMETD